MPLVSDTRISRCTRKPVGIHNIHDVLYIMGSSWLRTNFFHKRFKHKKKKDNIVRAKIPIITSKLYTINILYYHSQSGSHKSIEVHKKPQCDDVIFYWLNLTIIFLHRANILLRWYTKKKKRCSVAYRCCARGAHKCSVFWKTKFAFVS